MDIEKFKEIMSRLLKAAWAKDQYNCFKAYNELMDLVECVEKR